MDTNWKPWDAVWSWDNCVVDNGVVFPDMFWVPNWWASENFPMGFRRKNGH